MRSVVVYYSFEGNVRMLAQQIARTSGAELVELSDLEEPKTKGFMKFVQGGGKAMLGRNTRLGVYDVQAVQAAEVVFIGTPVWAFTCSPAVRTFLAEMSLQGKNWLSSAPAAAAKGKPFSICANWQDRLMRCWAKSKLSSR